MYNKVDKEIIERLIRVYTPHINAIERLYLSLRCAIVLRESYMKYFPHGGRILSLGCGFGIMENFLADQSSSRYVVGIDCDRHRIEVARKTIAGRKNIDFISGRLEDLKLKEKWDCVLLFDLLHHIPLNLQEELLEKISKILNPSGRLIVKDISYRPFLKWLYTAIQDKVLYFGTKVYYRTVEKTTSSLKRYYPDVSTEDLTKGSIYSHIVYTAKIGAR